MSVTIRKSDPKDTEAIFSLLPRLADFPLPEGRSPEDIIRKTASLVAEALQGSSGDAELLVAAEDQTVIGFVLLQTRNDFFTGEPHGYVADLAVKKEVEGRGVGRLLLEASEHWARRRGYRRIVLHALSGNERAKGIYEKFGFKQDTIQYAKMLSS